MFNKPKTEEKTKIIEAKDEKQRDSELTPEDKKTLDLIKAYQQKYFGIYEANNFFELSPLFIEAEKMNLKFAAYSEIVGLKEDIKELTKTMLEVIKTTK